MDGEVGTGSVDVYKLCLDELRRGWRSLSSVGRESFLAVNDRAVWLAKSSHEGTNVDAYGNHPHAITTVRVPYLADIETLRDFLSGKSDIVRGKDVAEVVKLLYGSWNMGEHRTFLHAFTQEADSRYFSALAEELRNPK